MAYQRTVRFEVRGIVGRCDRHDFVTWGGAAFPLDDLDMDNGIRHAIHKVRNREWPEPKSTTKPTDRSL